MAIEETDGFMELVRQLDRAHAGAVEAGPPAFLVPPTVERELQLPVCIVCRRGIVREAHGCVLWRGGRYHPACALGELRALRSAAA